MVEVIVIPASKVEAAVVLEVLLLLVAHLERIVVLSHNAILTKENTQ